MSPPLPVAGRPASIFTAVRAEISVTVRVKRPTVPTRTPPVLLG